MISDWLPLHNRVLYFEIIPNYLKALKNKIINPHIYALPFLIMLTVQQLLSGKSINSIYTINTDQMVIEALELMAEKNIGALMVMEGDRLAGIFSERDYARKGIIQGRKAKSTSMNEVMTSNVISVSPAQSIEVCMQLMSTKKIRHLPVVDNGTIVGILSISDIVTAIIHEQEHRIQNLEQYISGSY